VGLSSGNLIALSEINGKLSASYEPGTGVFATPYIDRDGWIYIQSNQANLHALRIAWHRPQDDFEWNQWNEWNSK
jgi:hypothetical protein